MKILRIAVSSVLTTANITYDGTAVPHADEKKKITQSANLFIILGTQQETDDNTSDAFITDSSIDIEIQHRTEFEISKDAIDDVSDQVLTALMPTPSTDGFPVQNLFQILLVRRSSALSRNFSITDSQSVVAKIITITCKIVQQNP
jgi:hypothetical protein